MAECPTAKLLLETVAFNVSKLNATQLFDPFVELEIASKEKVKYVKFIAYGIICPIIMALGILGNVTNLIVLTRPNLKGVTFVYLTWLAISDLTILVLSIGVMFSFYGIRSKTYSAAFYYSYVELQLPNAFMACSVFLVVSLTVERYFSVCLPTRFKDIHNNKWARRLIAAAYISAFVVNIPTIFNKISIAVPFSNRTEFISCDNPDVVKHRAFKAYMILKELMVRIGPAILLAVLNITIIVTFRKILKKKPSLHAISENDQQKENMKVYRREKKLITLLGGIVIIFFICNTPAALLRILISDENKRRFDFQVFRAVANCLELLNCAMNFYFYFMCSPEIRSTFIALVTCAKPTLTDSSANSKPSDVSNNVA